MNNNKKYTIINETFEINRKTKPENFIGVVEYEIGLKNGYYKEVESFDTKEKALEALKKYKCTYRKTQGTAVWFWNFDAYYLEEYEFEYDEYEPTDYIEFADIEL